MISRFLGVTLVSLNHVADIFASRYLVISSMFSRDKREITSGGKFGFKIIDLMYSRTSSFVLLSLDKKGFSNFDSHFDRETRECSSSRMKPSALTNSWATSSNNSIPGTTMVSTL